MRNSDLISLLGKCEVDQPFVSSDQPPAAWPSRTLQTRPTWLSGCTRLSRNGTSMLTRLVDQEIGDENHGQVRNPRTIGRMRTVFPYLRGAVLRRNHATG
jgi:hypothetical protein